MHVYVCIHAIAHVWRSENNFQELVFLFHFVGYMECRPLDLMVSTLLESHLASLISKLFVQVETNIRNQLRNTGFIKISEKLPFNSNGICL